MTFDSIRRMVWAVLVGGCIVVALVIASFVGGCGDDCACDEFTFPSPASEQDEADAGPALGGAESLPFDGGSDVMTSDGGSADGSGSGAVLGGSSDVVNLPGSGVRGIGDCVFNCVSCGRRGSRCVKFCKGQIR